MIVLSIDTNILLYALNTQAPEHRRARAFVDQCGDRGDVAICELVLVELYVLLRNPAVVAKPASSAQAAQVCQQLRDNPKWAIIDQAPIMDELWKRLVAPDVPRRRIFDWRLALTARHHGVTTWATRNTKDFEGMGFEQLVNPIDTE